MLSLIRAHYKSLLFIKQNINSHNNEGYIVVTPAPRALFSVCFNHSATINKVMFEWTIIEVDGSVVVFFRAIDEWTKTNRNHLWTGMHIVNLLIT